MKIIEKMKFKDGRDVTFRYPTTKDVKQIHVFFNKAIKETTFISRINPTKLKDTKSYVGGEIKKMKKRNASYIVVECEGKIIGSATIDRKSEEAHRHVGVFGIVILQEYTGKKIGTRLMQLIERDARKIKIELLQLSVCGRNERAQGLYRKMGFVEVGKIPNHVKRGSKYDDDIIMYKVLKK